MQSSALLVLFCFFVSIALAQEKPPALNGSWSTTCALIPNTPQFYQTKSTTYGVWDSETQSGTYTETINVFGTDDCNSNFQHYRIIYNGVYIVTGKKSEYVPLFWHMNVGINSKTLEVFTQSFANVLLAEPGCDMASIIPQTVMSIRHTNCEFLQILPIEECPQFFDIVRRQGNTVWRGETFVGQPIQWEANCQEAHRPRSADPYNYALAGTRNVIDNGVDLDYYFGSSEFLTSEFEPTATDRGITGYNRDEQSSDAFQVMSSMILIILCATFII